MFYKKVGRDLSLIIELQANKFNKFENFIFLLLTIYTLTWYKI